MKWQNLALTAQRREGADEEITSQRGCRSVSELQFKVVGFGFPEFFDFGLILSDLLIETAEFGGAVALAVLGLGPGRKFIELHVAPAVKIQIVFLEDLLDPKSRKFPISIHELVAPLFKGFAMLEMSVNYCCYWAYVDSNAGR